MIEETQHYPRAPFLTRFLAGMIDFGLVIFLSVFVSMFAYNGFANGHGKLGNAVSLQKAHLDSSHLANTNQQSYTSDQYFEEKDGNSLIISSLSYFYTIYLTGDTERASHGDLVSPNADVEFEYEDVKTTPRNLYSTEWFNTRVLELPVGEQVAKYDYFSYQKNELNEDDYSKIGVVNEKYIVDGQVNASDEMVSFIFDKYKEAANILLEQDYMVEYQNTIDNQNALITFICRLGFVLLFYEILPLCFKDGKSLGKLCMRLTPKNIDEEPAKVWQLLVRGLVALLIPVFLYFVKNIILQIIVVVSILLGNMIMYIIDKKNKRIIHDYIARTIVVEDINRN